MGTELLANEFLKWFRDGGEELRYLGLDPRGRPQVGYRDRSVSDAQIAIWVRDWLDRSGRDAGNEAPPAIAAAVRVLLLNFHGPL